MGVVTGCGQQEVGVASGCGEQEVGVASGCGCKEVYTVGIKKKFPRSICTTGARFKKRAANGC